MHFKFTHLLLSVNKDTNVFVNEEVYDVCVFLCSLTKHDRTWKFAVRLQRSLQDFTVEKEIKFHIFETAEKQIVSTQTANVRVVSCQNRRNKLTDVA